LARIAATHFGAGFVDCEHPFDTGACGVSLSFPGADFGLEALASTNPTVEALAAEHANFDLDHVQPAGVLGDVVEF
jgi:hypothetical protein